MKYLIAVLIGALLTVSGYAWWLHRENKVIASLRTELESSLEQLRLMQATAHAVDQAITYRDETLAAISEKREELERNLEEVLTHDAKAKDWGDGQLPADFSQWLRGPANGGANGTGAAAGGADTALPDAGVEGQHDK